MGDGYCIHHNGPDNPLLEIGHDFFTHVASKIDTLNLELIRGRLKRDSNYGCDSCGGEASRALLDIVIKTLCRRLKDIRIIQLGGLYEDTSCRKCRGYIDPEDVSFTVLIDNVEKILCLECFQVLCPEYFEDIAPPDGRP